MKASGNGLPYRCAYNLLRIVRGEVAYERTKGINGGLIDAPAATASDDIINDATQQLEIYEPRVDIESIDVAQALEEVGDVSLDLTLKRKEEET